MRFKYCGNHLNDSASIFGGTFWRSIVLNRVQQVSDRYDMAPFIGAIGSRFRFANSRGGDWLPLFA
jgi:hypothetical protein